MIKTLILPPALRDQVLREANAARPRECCGLIEGTYKEDAAQALICHPVRNLAAANDCFELDPARHIGLLKSLRGSGREIVGCYHSHPNGRAEPSARDLAGEVDGDPRRGVGRAAGQHGVAEVDRGSEDIPVGQVAHGGGRDAHVAPR